MSPSHYWYGVDPGLASVLRADRWSPWCSSCAAPSYLVRLLALGQAGCPLGQHPAPRSGTVILHVLAQWRLISGDFWPGLMHAIIFWGFVVLTLGTIEFFGRGVHEGFVAAVPVRRPPYLVAQDLLSVVVIAAVGYALFRRLVTRPRRLTLSTEGLADPPADPRASW